MVPTALELPPPNRIKLQSTKRSYGGPEINGKASCGFGEDGKFVGSGPKHSNQLNYELYSQFLIYFQIEKMHSTNNQQQWAEFNGDFLVIV